VDTTKTVAKVRAKIPKGASYSRLGESGPAGTLEAPDYCPVEVTFEGPGAELGRNGLARLDLWLELQDGRYNVVRLEATAPKGGRLDIEEVRAFSYAPRLRQALMGSVRRVTDEGEAFSADRPMDDPDPLWMVALIYATARATGEHPTKAVAHDLGIPETAAAQRVRRARAKGYLPATTPGKVH
jgi:hypothetical protein